MEETHLKIKKLLSLFLCAVMIFSFCGCEAIYNTILDRMYEKEPLPSTSSDSEDEMLEPLDPNWPVSVFGTELDEAPKKVAVASPALAEYLSDMDLLNNVCAVSDYCGFGSASSYKSIGSVRLPDMEAIKAVAPEYILTFSQYEESILIELQQMNITVIVIDAPKNLDELRSLFKNCALFFLGAVDGVTYGEAFVSLYNEELSSLAYTGEKKTAAFIRALDYTMFTGGTMENELLSLAGFINAAEEYSDYTFPADNWKDFDPDVLFINPNLHLIDLETNDLYKKKSAVLGDKVFNADLDVIALCSFRSLAIIKDMLATVYSDYTGGTPLSPAYPSMYSK